MHTRVYRNHSVQCSRPPGATEWSQREKQKNYWGQHKFCSRPQGSGYHGNSDCSQGYFTWSTYKWRSFILGEFNDPQKTASKLKNYIVLITVLDFHILFSVISWQVIPQDWWPHANSWTWLSNWTTKFKTCLKSWIEIDFGKPYRFTSRFNSNSGGEP